MNREDCSVGNRTGRLEGLDSLRGLMLILMMVNHLFFMNFAKWIEVSKVSYGIFGYVTAAEGFYFLSGLIFALVFTKKALAAPEDVQRKARSRTIELFAWHIVTLGFAVLTVMLVPATQSILSGNPFMGQLLQNPGLTFIIGLLFLAMPPFLNILPLYILFLYATPAIIQRLAKGHYWLVVSISLSLWGLAQTQIWFKGFGALQTAFPGLPIDGGYFDPMAWQVLFVGGLLIGSLVAKGRLAASSRLRPLFILASVVFFCFLLHKHGFFPSSMNFPQEWTDIERLGIVRLLNFTALAFITAILLAKKPKAFLIKPLMFLGRHSLHVFVYHVLFLYATVSMKNWIDDLAFFPSLILFSLFVGSLWIPAWLHEWFRIRQLTLLNPSVSA